MRFFNRRVFLGIAGFLIVVILAILGGIYFFVNSPGFEKRVHDAIVREVEQRTGGQATLQRFRWSFWDQRFVLENLTIRGLEAPTDPALANIKSILIGVNLRSLLKRRVDLFELVINQPEFHLTVDANGKTNLPSPPPRLDRNPEFQFSVENFRIAGGNAFVNERRIKLDLDLNNLSSELKYAPATRILSMQLAYNGALQLENKRPIPYRFSGNLDYTRGTIVAHRIDIKSGDSVLMLQGRVNDALTKDIAGRMEYAGVAAVPFLNHFFAKESFAGSSDVAGFLEFSNGYFFTRGTASAASITFEGWNAQEFRGEYSYHYPGRRLSLRRMKTRILDGTASGNISVEPLPGQPRVLLDLDYAGVDAAQLARIYPWDPKYRIYSRLTGSVLGWFEGKFDRFELGGNAAFASYTPQPDPAIVPLPLDGSSDYDGQPNRVRVQNAMLRLFSTDIQAAGLIDKDNSDLNVHMTSANLANVNFVYSNANGSGTFQGRLTGPIKTPTFDGQADVRGHKHGEWTIQRAVGGVRLDTLTQVANLRDVHVEQGQSEVVLNGSTTLDGSKVDLQARAKNVRSEDIAPYVTRVTDRKFTGVFSGAIHITSLNPIQFDDELRADDLVIEGQRIGRVTAMVSYREPAVELQKLTVSDNGATLTGNVSYNRVTEAMNFDLSIANSLNLDRFRAFGLPADLQGVVQKARFTGSGTLKQPRISGDAELTDLTFHGETFPQASLHVTSAGSSVELAMTAGRNLKLDADIDTSAAGYPFKATASFDRYSVGRLIGYTQGAATVSGTATLNGQLRDIGRASGSGTITAARVAIEDREFTSTRPFTFNFNPERLTLSEVSLSGPEGTRATVSGSVALTKEATMNFTVTDAELDLALAPTLLGIQDRSIVLGGAASISGTIRGTPQNPEFGGTARLMNASLTKPGLLVSISSLNGTVSFGANRVTFSDLEGRIGPGTIRMQGFAALQGLQLQNMNIQMETRDIRIRYPEGLRTILGGELVLRGSWNAPVLAGDLQIQSMSYRGEFEDFLALFQTANRFGEQSSEFGRLALSLHIEGSRNISIQNELADVEASVGLDIKGTVDRPAITGHVEARGGTLLFQGKRYQLTRGNLDFIDPFRIEPVIDIQAEADVREYRVIISIAGRGDRVTVDLRSDPPLSELEIVSLITGGKTREETAAAGGRVPTSEELFQGASASILSDMLKSRVVPSRLGLLGLERVRIDPLLSADASPSARITIPVQVTKDLSITYSYDLARNNEQLIQVEYFVSKNVSILGTRDEFGKKGLDIRLRRRY